MMLLRQQIVKSHTGSKYEMVPTKYDYALQIDPSTIIIMDDNKLEEIFPKTGDRLAVVHFCRREVMPKKQGLIDRLKSKIQERNAAHFDDSSQKKEKASKKATRIVELGWMYASGTDQFRQVRKLSGGGTRQIQVEQTAKVSQLKAKAIELFFPGGISPKGKISDFASVFLVDFKLNELDETLTVRQYFELTALTKLRFYLATRNLNEESSARQSGAFQPKKEKRKRAKYQFSSDEDDRIDYRASTASTADPCQELLMYQDNEDVRTNLNFELLLSIMLIFCFSHAICRQDLTTIWDLLKHQTPQHPCATK